MAVGLTVAAAPPPTLPRCRSITRQHLADYIATNYTAPRMVISAAGAVDHDALVKVGGAGSRGSKLGAGEEAASWGQRGSSKLGAEAAGSSLPGPGLVGRLGRQATASTAAQAHPQTAAASCKRALPHPPCLPPQAAEKAFSKLPSGGKTANELVKEVRRQKGGGGWAALEPAVG